MSGREIASTPIFGDRLNALAGVRTLITTVGLGHFHRRNRSYGDG
jgi:hypothetical protein